MAYSYSLNEIVACLPYILKPGREVHLTIDSILSITLTYCLETKNYLVKSIFGGGNRTVVVYWKFQS